MPWVEGEGRRTSGRMGRALGTGVGSAQQAGAEGAWWGKRREAQEGSHRGRGASSKGSVGGGSPRRAVGSPEELQDGGTTGSCLHGRLAGSCTAPFWSTTGPPGEATTHAPRGQGP